MPVTRHYIIALLLAILATGSQADPITDTRKHLFENQRNIILLRKEKTAFLQELKQAKQQLAADNDTDTDQSQIKTDIIDIQDSLAVADVIISNITKMVARQRLLLATLERGTPPTALDIALNKALNSNLPELVKNLANNPAARKDIARLKALLKQHARVGVARVANDNSVFVAVDQHVAEDEFLRLLALFSDGIADEAEDKTIKITGTAGRTPFTENDILSYLGHRQYHMEITVYSGKMTFTIDGRPWQLSVPPEEDQATYILIYDISKEHPRLVMFNKLLLLE